MSIIDVVKNNPGKTALVVGAVVVVVYFATRGDNQPSVYGMSPSGVEAATAMQAAQLSAQSEAAQIAGQIQALAAHDASQLEALKIQAAYATNYDELQASTRMSEINAAQQVQSLVSTLEAATAQNAQNQQTAQTSIIVGGQTAQQQVLANALVQQSQAQAQVAASAINAQVAIAQINKPKRGLFSAIFG